MTARKVTASTLEAIAKKRESFKYSFHIPGTRALGSACDQKILFNCETGEEAASFGNHCDSHADTPVCSHVTNVSAIIFYMPSRGFMGSGDRAQQRGLSGAVSANESKYLTLRDRKRNATHGLQQSVPSLKIFDVQQAHADIGPR